MQIGKILFWINVNLCFQYDGWPSGMEMPPTSMYGDHHARWGKYSVKNLQNPNKNLKSSFAGLPWTPWRQPTTRQQPSTWIIHPGRTPQPHPNCDKVAIPCKKIVKSRSQCNCPPAGVPAAWFGHWRLFWAIRPWSKNASISEVYQRNKSKKLASINLLCSFKCSFF